jgi:hypothetical protein
MINEVGLNEEAGKAEKIGNIQKKWGGLVAKNGWAAVPRTLIENQGRLGLKCAELTVLLNLISEWWEPSSEIYPSKKTLALRTGKSEQYIGKVLASLQTKKVKIGTFEVEGLIDKEFRFNGDVETSPGKFRANQTSNKYTLTNLRKVLTAIQHEADNEATESKAAKKQSRIDREIEIANEHSAFLEILEKFKEEQELTK